MWGKKMMHTKRVKLFQNGASQAVRLPVDFRFDGKEIYATKDDVTGDVILSTHPSQHAWHNFFSLVHRIKNTEAFMNERPMNTPPKAFGIFEDE